MKRRIISLIVLTAFVTMYLSGCKGFISKPEDANLNEVIDSNETIDPKDVIEIEFTSDDYRDVMEEFSVLGEMEYSLDSNRKYQVHYENQQIIREIETDQGATWTLTIPEDALPTDQSIEITITPMLNVTNSKLDGKFIGLLLEPEGLVFAKPIQLEYTSIQRDNHIACLGSSDGENLEVLSSTPTKNGFITEIAHFSSAYTNEEELTPENVQILQDVFMEKAEQILKEKIRINVPSIDLENVSGEFMDQLANTRKELIGKEFYLAKALAALIMPNDEENLHQDGCIC